MIDLFLQYFYLCSLENIQRTPGDVWMINGPLVYIPPVEVQVQDRRYGYAVHCSTV